MTDIAALRANAQQRFRDVWTQEADVTRPVGVPTFDPNTGTYTDATTSVATAMRCALTTESVPETRDVAGDPTVLTRLVLRYDAAVRLKVDDRVVFTVHDDASVVGTTFHVIGVAEAYEHIFGLAYLQRSEPDSGS